MTKPVIDSTGILFAVRVTLSSLYKPKEDYSLTLTLLRETGIKE